MIIEKGIENRWQKHAHLNAGLWMGRGTLERELFADPDDCLNPLTTSRVSEDLEVA